MNGPARRQGGTVSPLGRLADARDERASPAGALAVGFDPIADAGQGPANQRGQLGTMLLSPTQRTPQLRVTAASPARFGYIELPPYVGWVQLFPRVALPNIDPVPDDALPTRVGYFNGTGPLPDQNDSAGVIEWVKSKGVLFHTHFSVTLESPSTLIYGTPFSEAAPVFLPAGINVAVFQGQLTGLAWSDHSNCFLTAISAPINEQLLLPAPRP